MSKKIFYGVVPKQWKPNDMYVLLLSPNKKTAKRLYEHWNDNMFKCTDQYMKDAGLSIKRIFI